MFDKRDRTIIVQTLSLYQQIILNDVLLSSMINKGSDIKNVHVKCERKWRYQVVRFWFVSKSVI